MQAATEDRPEQNEPTYKAGENLGRELSAWTVMFHQAIAERVGLNASEHKCLDLVLRYGPMTAGQLAELTGLTTGAITGVVDRLEAAGFVQRQNDPSDRRRVIIRPDVKKAEREIGPLFESIARATDELASRYSERELALINQFVAECIRILRQETLKLRREAVTARKRQRAEAPADEDG